MEDLSGRSFGPYRIVAPLGAGGMASVYKAYQPAVDRHVALKVLPRHLAQDREFLARFEQEAKILASLQHPHILPVHDYGESDGFTYIVMPFIKTGTLAAVIDGHPLPLEQIRRVVSQVGDALDCAHARGLVHRDVKPSNILLDERGNCLLADFGIAKILEGADTLTATGGLIGTPKYMSPEQGMGDAIDGRSDLYSLGVVLYEMATGRVPFDAETPLAIVVKHIRDPLPLPSEVNPNIPDVLERMILRAMHKEPAERFGSAADMVARISTVATANAGEIDGETTVLIGGVPPLPTDVGAPPSSVPAPSVAASPTVATSASSPSGRTNSTGRWLAFALAAAAVVVLVLLWLRPPARESGTQAVLSLTDPSRGTESGSPSDPGTRAVPAVDSVPTPAGTVGPATTDTDTTAESTSQTPDAPARTPAPARPVAQSGGVDVGGGAVDQLVPDAPRADNGALLAETAGIEPRPTRDAASADPGDPFPDLGDGTLLDRQLGLRWTTTGNPSQGVDGLLWTDADAYCQGLALGASSTWRLPTQPELDSVLQRLDPTRYPWGLTLWSADRDFGDPNRLWVTNSPLYAPEWSSAIRDLSARRLTHRAVCVTADTP